MIGEHVHVRTEQFLIDGEKRWFLLLEVGDEMPMCVGPYDSEDDASAAVQLLILMTLEHVQTLGVPVECEPEANGAGVNIVLRAGGCA
jgi:hypothetical protein